MRWIPGLALALMIGCADPVPDPPHPFQEIVDQGLNIYLGSAAPSEVTDNGDGTRTYHFDPDDGPICLGGAPFSAMTRSGEGDGLILFLQGGGACWSTLCQAFYEVLGLVPPVGILNTELPVNPVADWDVGYVSYCDGSLFAGDVDIDDDGDGVIDRYHRGLHNLSVSLEAFKTEFPNPSRILLVGSSAGAYGTIIASALARSVYPEVPLDVVADAGIGLGKPGKPESIQSLIDEWNISHLIPESCTDCVGDGHITGVTDWALSRDPNLRVFAISSEQDIVISFFFLALSGPLYAEHLLAETAELEAAHPGQFHRFIFEGDRHTTVSIDTTADLSLAAGIPLEVDPALLSTILGTFDGTKIGGVSVAEWLADGLAGVEGFSSLVESEMAP